MARIGLGQYQRATYQRLDLGLYLCHLCPEVAAAIRHDEPSATLVGRFDPGRDDQQVGFGGDPAAEADRFFEAQIAPAVRRYPGVYSVALGINEAWPDKWDKAGLRWRAAFELRLCRRVQGELGLPYAWGSISVGCLEPEDVELFTDVWREAAWVNYHAYLPPGVLTVQADQGPWYLYRPTRLWLPELRRLGIPLRLLVGECGPYQATLHGSALARLEVGVARAVQAECARLGVPLVGPIAYGRGMMGDQSAWELEGQESLLVEANAAEPAPVPLPAVVPAPPRKEDQMKLWLAIFPSNQAYNRFDGTNEQAQMALLAAQVLAASRRYPVISARVFTGKPESDPNTNPDLRAQLREGYAWLDTAPPGTLTTAWHLHSDSGRYRHVGAYWGNADITRRLALALRAVLAQRLGVSVLTGVNYEERGYLAWTLANGRHCPVILECDTHELPEAVAALRTQGPQLAEDLVRSGLRFFGLDATPAVDLNWSEVAVYSQWAAARVANREEPRDRSAFATHLKALGCDWTDLWRYGCPVR